MVRVHIARSGNPQVTDQFSARVCDAIEIGPAVDVLGEGLPRPRTRCGSGTAVGDTYPNALHGALLAADFLASERLARG